MNNDVIDLSAAAAAVDEHVVGGRVIAGNLELDMAIGGVAGIVIPVAGAGTDDFVVNGIIDPIGNTLTLNRTLGGAVVIAIPPGGATDTFVASGIVNLATRTLDLFLSDGSPVTPIDLAGFYSAVYVEKGGLEWDPTTGYLFGDMVTENVAGVPTAYMCMVGTLNVLPSSDPASWVPIGGAAAIPERGGVLWDVATPYLVGDIVSENAITYTAILPNTGLSPVLTPGAWIAVGGTEVGGRAFSALNAYLIGDIVTNLGTVYECIVNTPIAGPFVPASWEQVSERGGIVWNVATTYKMGDIVNGTTDNKVYVCFNALGSTGVNPVTGVDWEEVTASRYNVGTFTPALATEYPSVVALTDPGAVWYVTGVDPILGYTMTTGPLTGVVFMNNDKYVWFGDPDSAPDADPLDDIWLWEPFPRIKGEVGGVAFSTAVDYLVGDIVTETATQEIYQCIVNVLASPTLPSGDPISWKHMNTSAITDITYDPLVTYPEGSIVVGPAPDYDLFIAPVGGVPIGVTPPTAPWVNTTPMEVGGRGHKITGVLYSIGDTATVPADGWLYVAITNHVSAATCVGDAVNWTQPPPAPYFATTYNFIATANQTDFACATSDTVRIAQAWVEGFEVPTVEINTSIAGIVRLDPVSLNAAVKITV